MPRAYDSKVVALTVGHPFKWVDNLLSQNDLPGVARSRQGVARVITDEGLLAVEITRMLASDVGLSLSRAALIARRVVASEGRTLARVALGAGLVLEIDVPAVERRLQSQLLSAMEAASRPRRGRPPKRTLSLPD